MHVSRVLSNPTFVVQQNTSIIVDLITFICGIEFIILLKRVPALRTGWGRVPYDCAFGALTCGHM